MRMRGGAERSGKGVNGEGLRGAILDGEDGLCMVLFECHSKHCICGQLICFHE